MDKKEVSREGLRPAVLAALAGLSSWKEHWTGSHDSAFAPLQDSILHLLNEHTDEADSRLRLSSVIFFRHPPD